MEGFRMKCSWALVSIMVVFLGMNAGCSSTEKVVAIQGDFSKPYESLGTIEVDRRAPRIQSRRIFGQVWEWITFGYVENISQEAYLQGLLNKKILKAAQKNHQAEAVIQMKYWPDLSSPEFPQGLIYAKGEMIRHKRFPE